MATKIPANTFSPNERELLRKAVDTYSAVLRRGANNAKVEGVAAAMRAELDALQEMKARL